MQVVKFNSGHEYHGSDDVMDGKLTGATDTDYFYFFCPKCSDKHILRILEYGVQDARDDNPYNAKFDVKAKSGFTLAFKLYCEQCKFTDFVKISNTGWQEGTHENALMKCKQK